MGVSQNRGTPNSSILIGFSNINHQFWGTPIFGNTQIFTNNLRSLSYPSAHHSKVSNLGNLDSPVEDLESCGFPESTSHRFTKKNMQMQWNQCALIGSCRYTMRRYVCPFRLVSFLPTIPKKPESHVNKWKSSKDFAKGMHKSHLDEETFHSWSSPRHCKALEAVL